MTNWQLTATDIYGDSVDDVSIMIYKDWSTGCTGYKKHAESLDQEAAKTLKRKAKQLGRNLKCEVLLDHRVTDYRDRLVAEDKATPAQKKVAKKKRA